MPETRGEKGRVAMRLFAAVFLAVMAAGYFLPRMLRTPYSTPTQSLPDVAVAGVYFRDVQQDFTLMNRQIERSRFLNSPMVRFALRDWERKSVTASRTWNWLVSSKPRALP
jgi:hypothetical protein